MKTWWARIRRRWLALRRLRSLRLVWLFLRVGCFAATVPILMRLRLPTINRLLDRRIASAMKGGGDSNQPADVMSCLESALTLGAPLLRPSCLRRGLTLYYFMRRSGLDVSLHFGARHSNGVLVEAPGHCWLEKDGHPFLENEDPYEHHLPIYRLPAPLSKPTDLS